MLSKAQLEEIRERRMERGTLDYPRLLDHIEELEKLIEQMAHALQGVDPRLGGYEFEDWRQVGLKPYRQWKKQQDAN